MRGNADGRGRDEALEIGLLLLLLRRRRGAPRLPLYSRRRRLRRLVVVVVEQVAAQWRAVEAVGDMGSDAGTDMAGACRAAGFQRVARDSP